MDCSGLVPEREGSISAVYFHWWLPNYYSHVYCPVCLVNGSDIVGLAGTIEEDAAWVWAKSELRCTLLQKVYATFGNGNGSGNSLLAKSWAGEMSLEPGWELDVQGEEKERQVDSSNICRMTRLNSRAWWSKEKCVV